MKFEIYWTEEAWEEYQRLKNSPSEAAEYKQVKKAIEFMAVNLRHPSLNTHKMTSVPNLVDPDQDVFESYAQNNTPAAKRVFWYYGPKKGQITILGILNHPD
jgi:hypothetical protein